MAIENLEQKIAQIIEKKGSTWKQDAEWRRENRSWLKKSANIAICVLDRMEELGWNQKKLAEELGTTPQYVSKLCKGQENLTLKNIDALEKILGISLITENKDSVEEVKSIDLHFTQEFDFLLKSFRKRINVELDPFCNSAVISATSVRNALTLNPTAPNTAKSEVIKFAMSA